MKQTPTNFAKHLTDFLTIYLSGQKNVSKNTISSYRDTFKLLLKYCQNVKGIIIGNINIETLNTELIVDFLSWLEHERNCSITTRNQRLAVIHSFFRYVQSEEPAGIYHYQRVISIPAKKPVKKLVRPIIKPPKENAKRLEYIRPLALVQKDLSGIFCHIRLF